MSASGATQEGPHRTVQGASRGRRGSVEGRRVTVERPSPEPSRVYRGVVVEPSPGPSSRPYWGRLRGRLRNRLRDRLRDCQETASGSPGPSPGKRPSPPPAVSALALDFKKTGQKRSGGPPPALDRAAATFAAIRFPRGVPFATSSNQSPLWRCSWLRPLWRCSQRHVCLIYFGDTSVSLTFSSSPVANRLSPKDALLQRCSRTGCR
ncbi:hypothetical protein M885DRAFT_504069 [Pelagophyceae sp. CCMP2097]|nr:hypothetical protein M885DRAFT_504069 [Pelagophyceae sp. CCMP2097]|mmetsp:Transcript_16723/g.59318  ORF Transcript_16723/g.59318 Transcript_16723/m.59318 type:complete len:207 (+) Transcript_16723:267-887(+)